MQFKTNIRCGACVANVNEPLNKLLGEGNWKVDLQSPERLLQVFTEAVSAKTIVDTLQLAGYRAELLN